MSAGTLALLLWAIVIIYNPIPDDVSNRVIRQPASEMTSVVQSVHSQTRTFTSMVREQTKVHTELVTFSLAAAILFGLMLRS